MAEKVKGKRTKRVERWNIYDLKIGSGSYASVYYAKHLDTQQECAVKVVSKDRLNSKLLANLGTEIKILQDLVHKNIVQLYDIQDTDKRVYIFLEYCRGGDLSRYLKKRGRLEESQAKYFLVQLVEGIKFLRRRNLVHRDLKPHNLLLTVPAPDGILKISDFGFARYVQPHSLVSTICGSPLYMAPEILKLQSYDAKSDLWSVGVILYELLFGKTPFTGSSQLELLSNIEREEVTFPKEFPVSPHCIDLLKGLLQKNPISRISYEDFFDHPYFHEDESETPTPTTPLKGSQKSPTAETSPQMKAVTSADSVESAQLHTPLEVQQQAASNAQSCADTSIDYEDSIEKYWEEISFEEFPCPENYVHKAKEIEKLLFRAQYIGGVARIKTALDVFAESFSLYNKALELLEKCLRLCMEFKEMPGRIAEAYALSCKYLKKFVRAAERIKDSAEVQAVGGMSAQNVLFLEALEMGKEGAILEMLNNEKEALRLYSRSVIILELLTEEDLAPADKEMLMEYLTRFKQRVKA